MMAFTNFDPKDPDATNAFKFDFSRWLGTGETISSYSFPDFPSGLTKVSDSNTTSVVTVFISGGTAGQSYDVTCRINTTASQIEDLTGTIPVSEQ